MWNAVKAMLVCIPTPPPSWVTVATTHSESVHSPSLHLTKTWWFFCLFIQRNVFFCCHLSEKGLLYAVDVKICLQLWKAFMLAVFCGFLRLVISINLYSAADVGNGTYESQFYYSIWWFWWMHSGTFFWADWHEFLKRMMDCLFFLPNQVFLTKFGFVQILIFFLCTTQPLV